MSRSAEPWTDRGPPRARARAVLARAPSRSTIRVAPARDHTYAVTGVPATAAGTAVLVVADVTEQERRERAEREFVANAAHELRTPLTAIASAVEVLQQGARDEPVERDRFLALIERQTTRLDRLGRALLTSPALKREPSPCDLVPCRRCDRAPRDRRGHGARRVALERRATGDRARRMPICSDTRSRTSSPTPAGTRTGKGSVVSAEGSRRDPIVVEVRDKGPGMTPADAERVVERFFRERRSRCGRVRARALDRARGRRAVERAPRDRDPRRGRHDARDAAPRATRPGGADRRRSAIEGVPGRGADDRARTPRGCGA